MRFIGHFSFQNNHGMCSIYEENPLIINGTRHIIRTERQVCRGSRAMPELQLAIGRNEDTLPVKNLYTGGVYYPWR
jgi:hypothetical protein